MARGLRLTLKICFIASFPIWGFFAMFEALDHDYCVLDIPAQYHPAYITTCWLFGEEPPRFELYEED